MLLEQFIIPFTMNPNVNILLRMDSCNIEISGVSDVVKGAFDYISNQLNRHLYVEDRYVDRFQLHKFNYNVVQQILITV